jgi:hypothetical protein
LRIPFEARYPLKNQRVHQRTVGEQMFHQPELAGVTDESN